MRAFKRKDVNSDDFRTAEPRPLIGAVSGGAALVCIALLGAYLALDPRLLDQHLRDGITRVALALPLLLLAALLALWVQMTVIPYILLFCGCFTLQYAIYAMLQHIDTTAAEVFMRAASFCMSLFIVCIAWRGLQVLKYVRTHTEVLAALKHARQSPVQTKEPVTPSQS